LIVSERIVNCLIHENSSKVSTDGFGSAIFRSSPSLKNESNSKPSRTQNTMSLLHGPASGSENEPPEDPAIQARNARLGLQLFGVYALIYALYVITGAFLPGVMKAGLAGVNVAVVWGFFLIVLAFVMALVYGRLCDRPMSSHNQENSR
jgi:uncharacterized membrane protein (DUF485 family)